MPNSTSLKKSLAYELINLERNMRKYKYMVVICQKIRYRGSNSIFKTAYAILSVILANYFNSL